MVTEALLREIGKFPAAVISDATAGGRVLPASIVPQIPVGTVVGPAYTVKLPPGDNLGLHIAIAEAPPSSVIIAAVEGDVEFGLWGEVASSAASHAGLAGFVTDSFVRDSRELIEIGFPVFAKGRSLRKTQKKDPGVHQVDVRLGGIIARPGDLVVGDSDGVVVISPGDVEGMIARAKEIALAEQRIVAEVIAGHSTLDLLNLRSAMGAGHKVDHS